MSALDTSDPGTVSFLTPHNNPLIDLGFTSSFPVWAQFALVALTILLGICAYTDLYQGWIIKNEVTGAIAVITTVSSLFLFDSPVKHFLIAAAMIVVIFALYMFGVFREGDLKIFSALAMLLAQGVVLMIFMSFTLIVLYSIPTMIKSFKSRDVAQARGHRLGSAPAGPGIAGGFVWFLYFCGLSAAYSAALLAIMAVTVVIGLATVGIKDPAVIAADAREAKRIREAEMADYEAKREIAKREAKRKTAERKAKRVRT